MAFVLQITWKRDMTSDNFFGTYIVDYDPTLDKTGNYLLTISPSIMRARSFITRDDAVKYFNRPAPNVHFMSGGAICPLFRNYYVEVIEI